MNCFKKYKKQICSLLVCMVVLGGSLLIAIGIYSNRKELANDVANSISQQQEENNPLPQEESTSMARLDAENVEWKGKTYKRNSYIKAILCAGIDRDNTMTEEMVVGEAGQSDALFLLAQDTARNLLKILIIPRDTITEITVTDKDGNILGKGLDHLSLAFSYGDGMQKSCEYMTESVSELFCGLKIDSYLATDMAVISDLNDAVGGVTVTIPDFGMEDADPSFIPGEQVTLTGELAEKFVRYRNIEIDNSAIYRMNQQKEYVIQYFKALQRAEKENPQLVTDLFALLEEYMITNMPKDEYMKIAVDAVATSEIGAESFYMVPGKGITTDEYDEFYVDEEGMISVILDLFYREIT